MTTRDIRTSIQDTVCDVCGRTLLRGEQADVYLDGGTRRSVCELCKDRALHGGWVREGTVTGYDEAASQPDRRRSLWGRLLGRRERAPAPNVTLTLRDELDGHAWSEADLPTAVPPAPEAPAAGAVPPAPEAPAADAVPPASEAPAAAAGAVPPAPEAPAADPGAHQASGSEPASDSAVELSPPRRSSLRRNLGARRVNPDRRRQQPREPRHVRAVPSSVEQKIVSAAQLFNDSEHPRTVAGVARSLGPPDVCVLPASSRPSLVTLVISWELCWYRFEVDLSDERPSVRSAGQGYELSELDPEELRRNAVADEHGALRVGG